MKDSLYDSATGVFKLTGAESPCLSAATLLPDGKVLFAGGECYGREAAAQLYEPATRAFNSTGSMGSPRVWHTLTLLPNGQVLATGGGTDSCAFNGCTFAGTVATAELYDPASGAFSATGRMTVDREVHTATLLNDGRVLLTGGVRYGGIGLFYGPSASAELYTPSVLVPAPRLFSLSADGKGQGAIWHATTGEVASPSSPAVGGEILAMHTNNLIDGGVIPAQVAVGGRLAEVLYFGDAPGYPGYNQVNFRVPSGIAPGPTVPVRLSYVGRTSNAVTIAVQ